VDTEKPKKIDIIISGHYNNQNLITKIKENIEDWGLIAWTTVDQNAHDLQANASEAIKSTIKSCKCVLMCRNNFYLTFNTKNDSENSGFRFPGESFKNFLILS
jgi:hypothetical protein